MKSRRKQNGQFERNTVKWQTKGNIAYCYVNGIMQFFTDRENINLFDGRQITKMADGYSATMDNGKMVLVHRFITGAPDGVLVDHINRDKKDNRKENLRFADKSLNAFNTGLRSNNTSGCTGVSFRKDTGKWTAEIKVYYKNHSLGCFKTKEEAIKARKKAEVEFFGI